MASGLGGQPTLGVRPGEGTGRRGDWLRISDGLQSFESKVIWEWGGGTWILNVLCRWHGDAVVFSGGVVPVALCRWRCSGGVVPVALFRWRCSGGVVPVALFRWRCSGGVVPVALFRWRCSGGVVPVALCPWRWPNPVARAGGQG